jgi:predicted alpha/beta superfamily hydrolase
MDVIQRFLLISLALVQCLVLSSLCAAADPAPTDVAASVVLDSSQIFNIHSAASKQNYRFQVRLPGSYLSKPTKTYPLIIKVDGQWDYPLAASVFNNIYFDGQMPETIILGIEWADVEGNIQAVRARDLLPAPLAGFAHSGQAKQFIAVLANDILPALKQRFRLNGQTFLLGGSWGGTFVSFALLERPDVVDGAIAIGGDYAPAAEVFQRQLTALAGTQRLAGKRLYLGVGAGDGVAPDVFAFADKLKSAKLSGFNLKLESLAGFGHSGMNVPGYAGGYQYMFERPQVSISAAALKQYLGKYVPAHDNSESDNAEGFSLQVEAKQLQLITADETLSLLAKSEREFYLPDTFFNLTFEGNQAKIETFFGETSYKRIDAVAK